MNRYEAQPFQITAHAQDRLAVVSAQIETDQSISQPFEYMDRGQRVDTLKTGIASTFGIDNPRFDSTEVFDLARLDENDDIHEADAEIVRLNSRGVMSNSLSTVMLEYYSDVTDHIVETIKVAKQIGVTLNPSEVQEALVDFGVKSAFQLHKFTGSDIVLHRIRQFVINTQQRVQMDVLSSSRPLSFHDALVQRQFDEELHILEQATPERFSPTSKTFMKEKKPDRVEKAMLGNLEDMIGTENIQGFQVIRRAQRLAKIQHNGQSHLGLVDYPIHLNRVSLRLMEDPYFSDKPDELVKALTLVQLHDILEDTYCPPETVEGLFGNEMLQAVDSLSKFKRIDFDPSQPVDLTSYYSKIARQPAWVRYVKGYDRVDNWYASYMKVDSEIEDKMNAIKAQEMYLEETRSYFEGLVGDNPTLVSELQKAVNRP